jgi:hypothetical protein
VTPSTTARWLDDFLEAYVAARPVHATFLGDHRFDGLLQDLSDEGVGDVQAGMEGLLTRAARLEGERGSMAPHGSGSPDRVAAPLGRGDPEAPGPSPDAAVEAVDLRLAKGFLKLSLWERESGHHLRGNPAWATGEAAFGVMSPFMTDFAPLVERAESATERLQSVPDFLGGARRWLEAGPGSHPRWTRRAATECTGALAFLEDGLPLLAEEVRKGPGNGTPAQAQRLLAAGAAAARAFSDHHAWLESDHLRHTTDVVGCGAEILDLHIKEGHHLPESAREIASYARDEMARVQSELIELARRMGAESPMNILDRLRDRHPDADGYLGRYQEIWDDCYERARAEELVTWPEDPIRYRLRPRWARAAAPHLYFLFYRAPAAFDRPAVHEYWVAPPPEGRDRAAPDPEEMAAFLRANHDYVIKANHVIHHGGVGHHVQNGHAYRTGSRIGRIAAVDCAARIAMHCGGTMAEGWACYATELMAEHGAMDPLEVFAERASRIRMCCRAVVDVELHRGRMTLEDAVNFYQHQAGMPESAAWSEAVKNSMFPGGALMYLMGTDGIRAIRRDREAELGDAFQLRSFHDELLSHGSIPVTLAGTLMSPPPSTGTLHPFGEPS